jgi:2-C-methyl-D-erythritol 2,4-cyclodiphosphate synthase
MALGDIGTHFPNTDERWQNAESSVFLRYALGLVKSRGYAVVNVDSTVSLEKPKLRPFIDQVIEIWQRTGSRDLFDQC